MRILKTFLFFFLLSWQTVIAQQSSVDSLQQVVKTGNTDGEKIKASCESMMKACIGKDIILRTQVSTKIFSQTHLMYQLSFINYYLSIIICQ